jgi:hypothetical protein
MTLTFSMSNRTMDDVLSTDKERLGDELPENRASLRQDSNDGVVDKSSSSSLLPETILRRGIFGPKLSS